MKVNTLIVFAVLLFTANSSGLSQEPTQPVPTRIDIVARIKERKDRDKFILKYDKFTDRTMVWSKPASLLSRGESFAASFARGMSRGSVGPQPDLPPTTFKLAAGFVFDGTTLTDMP